MNEIRANEKYRGHDLVLVTNQGVCKGRAWMKGAPAFEVTGKSAEAVAAELKVQVDERFKSADPAQEFVRALKSLVIAKRADSDWAMLKAHYGAPDRTMTATEIADAVGFPNYSTVNMRYGLLGKALYDEGLVNLPPLARHADGKPIYTFVIAEGERLEGENWRWKMRPEVAAAMEVLGLTT